MSKLKDIMAYLLYKIPKENPITNIRLAQMIYLADWKSCVNRHKQISNINWVFDNFGPYTSLVLQKAKDESIFDVSITNDTNPYNKFTISLNDSFDNKYPSLSFTEKKILKFLFNNTYDLNHSEFVDLVYNTYPIRTQIKYSYLNLVKLADEQTEEKNKNEIVKETNMNQDTNSFVNEFINNNISVFKRLSDR